jgi:K+ channel tetramerisation domain.
MSSAATKQPQGCSGENGTAATPLTLLMSSLRDLEKAVDQQQWRLHQDRQAFEARKQDATLIITGLAACEFLDVGGEHFHVGRAVLQRHAQHYLSVLGTGEFENTRDAEGYVFIDRDPQHFASVLAYLREGSIYTPQDWAKQGALLREARFYGITELCQALDVQDYLMGISLVGAQMRLHVYDAGLRSWRQLRHAPLPAEVAAHAANPHRYIALQVTAFGGGVAVLLKFSFGWLVLALDLEAWVWEVISPLQTSSPASRSQLVSSKQQLPVSDRHT